MNGARYPVGMSILMLSVSGCRGVVGETLTPSVVARFAGSYGTWLVSRAKGKPVRVVVGRDGRAGSEMVAYAAVSGLLGAGCDVVDLGVAMTPTTAVMTDAYARGEFGDGGAGPGGGVGGEVYTAGMVLTASHNPQQWNGLKCLLAEGGEHGSAACAPPATCANEIISLFQSDKPVGTTWNMIGQAEKDERGVEVHVERVLDAMVEAGLTDDPSQIGVGFKVAVDSVNGSGIEGARMLLEALGCDEVLHLGSEPTGLFSHPPEPTAENLSAAGGLCDAVREAGCDIGFAQDPDADRLAMVDERGVYIGEEYTLALGARAVMMGKRAQGAQETLVTNLSTSRMLEDVAASAAGGGGAVVVRTAVGEANVVETMKSKRSEVGGEGNGGVIWPRVAYVRDSLAAMALTLWLMKKEGKKLSELVAQNQGYAIEKRKVDLSRREDALPAIQAIAKAYASERVDLQDGVRVDFDSKRAWLHVRASNTEPIMRLIAEAPDVATARGILDEAARVIAGK